MKKKLFVILVASVFLIASAGFISAADDSSALKNIDVTKVWDDNGFESERPASVQVQLFADGKLVDTVTLSPSNGWHATFKNVDVSGNVKVVEKGSPSDYHVSYSGDAQKGFVITSKIIKAAASDDVLKADGSSDVVSDVNVTGDVNAIDDNSTENNSTDDVNSTVKKNTTDNNSSDNKNKNNVINGTDHLKKGNSSSTNITNKTIVKEVIKKDVPPKKPKHHDPKKLRNTGIPAVILILAAIGAIFVPLNFRKR